LNGLVITSFAANKSDRNFLNQSTNSKSIDILGAPVNICTKINDFTPENETVIGSDLYQMVKDIDDYKYKMINDYSIGLKNSYPIYLLQRK